MKLFEIFNSRESLPDEPVERSVGMGDTRSFNELKHQIENLDDETLIKWAQNKPGMLHSKVAKVQHRLVMDEIQKRGLA